MKALMDTEKNTGSDFCFALNALRDGKKVARSGWNGYGAYVKMITVPTEHYSAPSFAIVHPPGTVYMWTPTTPDLVATDWGIAK